MRDQVFISYSHRDEKWLLKLRTHLKPFERTHRIQVWDDTRIRSGDRWREEIGRALASARVAVLLVSPDYLASDFVVSHELPPLLAAAEREGLRILWVAVSASAYLETPIKDYQAANDPARPLDSLKTARLNEELVKVCEAVRSAMDAAAEPATAAAAPRPRQPRPRRAASPTPPAAPPPQSPPSLTDSGQRPISRRTLERVISEQLDGAKQPEKSEASARRYVVPAAVAACLLLAAGAWFYFAYARAKPLPPLTAVEVSDEFINKEKWTVPPTGWLIDKSSGQGSLQVSNQPQVGYLTGVAYADFNVNFNLRLLGNRGAAWAARVVDEKNYYLFYLSGPEGQYKNRFVTYVVRDGKIDPRSEQTTEVVAELKEGQFYEIDVAAAGNMITTTMTPAETGEKVVLGVLVDTSAAHPRGSFGFLTVQGEKFAVDDFFIRPPNIQTP